MDNIVLPDKDLLDRIEARYGEDFADFIHEAVLLYLNPDIPDIQADDHEFASPVSEFNVSKFIACIMSDLKCFTSGGIVSDIRLNDRDFDKNNYPSKESASND